MKSITTIFRINVRFLSLFVLSLLSTSCVTANRANSVQGGDGNRTSNQEIPSPASDDEIKKRLNSKVNGTEYIPFPIALGYGIGDITYFEDNGAIHPRLIDGNDFSWMKMKSTASVPRVEHNITRTFLLDAATSLRVRKDTLLKALIEKHAIDSVHISASGGKVKVLAGARRSLKRALADLCESDLNDLSNQINQGHQLFMFTELLYFDSLTIFVKVKDLYSGEATLHLKRLFSGEVTKSNLEEEVYKVTYNSPGVVGFRKLDITQNDVESAKQDVKSTTLKSDTVILSPSSLWNSDNFANFDTTIPWPTQNEGEVWQLSIKGEGQSFLETDVWAWNENGTCESNAKGHADANHWVEDIASLNVRVLLDGQEVTGNSIQDYPLVINKNRGVRLSLHDSIGGNCNPSSGENKKSAVVLSKKAPGPRDLEYKVRYTWKKMCD